MKWIRRMLKFSESIENVISQYVVQETKNPTAEWTKYRVTICADLEFVQMNSKFSCCVSIFIRTCTAGYYLWLIFHLVLVDWCRFSYDLMKIETDPCDGTWRIKLNTQNMKCWFVRFLPAPISHMIKQVAMGILQAQPFILYLLIDFNCINLLLIVECVFRRIDCLAFTRLFVKSKPRWAIVWELSHVESQRRQIIMAYGY